MDVWYHASGLVLEIAVRCTRNLAHNTTTATMDNAVAIETATCVVCHGIRPRDMLYCAVGHGICKACVKSMPRVKDVEYTSSTKVSCPKCKVCDVLLPQHFKHVRMFESITVQCPHNHCTERKLLPELDAHMSTCRFRHVQCKLCSGRFPNMVTHYENALHDLHLPNKAGSITITGLQMLLDGTHNGKTRVIPLLLDGRIFLLYLRPRRCSESTSRAVIAAAFEIQPMQNGTTEGPISPPLLMTIDYPANVYPNRVVNDRRVRQEIRASSQHICDPNKVTAITIPVPNYLEPPLIQVKLYTEN